MVNNIDHLVFPTVAVRIYLLA